MMDKTIRLILIIPVFVILLLLLNYTAAPRDPLVQDENVPPAYEKRGKLGIFGGTAVKSSAEFPFNLKLYHQGAFICGAAIIGPRIGITAAHCLTKDKRNPGNFQVIAGSVDFRFAANVATNGPIWKGEQGRRLTKIKLHPQYRSLLKLYDIAIFQVDEKFVFDKWVNEIPFPRTKIPGIVSTTKADPPLGFFPYLNKDFSHFSNSTNLEPPANLTGLTAIATGWGVTYQGLPKTLQKVELPVVECDNFFNWHIKGLDYPICAGIPNSGKDTCSGDSGGPLFIYVQPSVPLLVGITSFGFGCGGPTPGIYTNVRFYTEWIQEAALTLESGGHSNKAAVPPTLLLIIIPNLVWVQLSA